MFKQVIVVRDDLKLSVGKLCVQCCHASLGAYRETDIRIRKQWGLEGGKKVVLHVRDKQELLKLELRARRHKLPTFLVRDAGLTEVPPGTVTALGIGPEDEEKIDKITFGLPLLK
jgi:PTH2 family peptidyl-tRNA hydrolase